jgi:hypothetical protein
MMNTGKTNKAKARVRKPSSALTDNREWIPAEEFCRMYKLPATRPPRKSPPKRAASHRTACRKCVEGLARKGLIDISKTARATYVSRESALRFGRSE